MAPVARPPVERIAQFQLMVLLFSALVVLLFGVEVAGSVLLGGLIQILPQAWFTHKAWRYRGASRVHQMVRGFYLGQSGKLLLICALFALAFDRFTWLRPLPLIAGFTAMIVVQFWVTAKIVSRSR